VRMWSGPEVLARVADAAGTYRARREAFAAAAGVPAPPSGINVWVPVPDEDAAVRALLAEGWAVAAGTPYRLSGGPAVRVTVAALDVAEAPALAAALARAVAPALRTRAA
jgi:hypothetical protein